MHIITNKTTLLKELNAIARVVEKKTPLPILASLLLAAQGDKLTITGTDLDLSLISTISVEVKEPGAICLAAKKFFEVVKSLPDAEIALKLDKNDQLVITCDKAKFKMPTQPKINFPEIPAWKGTSASVPATLLQAFIERTVFASTNEESRYALNGTKFELKPDSLRMVATDGHRLAFVEQSGAFGATTPVDVTIPKKTLGELLKLTSETTNTVEIGHDTNHFFFRAGTRTLITRLITGQFPNYEMVLPKANTLHVTMDASQLGAAVRRVALMADDRAHAIKLEFVNNQLTLSAQSSDVGEAGETLPIEWPHQPLTTGFNAEYLIDYLSIIGGQEVRLELKDGNSQMEAKPTQQSDYQFRYVMMPMRLN